MKDNINWPFIAVIDIMAFILSLTGGLLGGVGIGLLLLRSIVVLAVFSIIATAVNILAVKIFPEIFTMTIDADLNETESAVDVLIDEGMPLENEDYFETKLHNAESDMWQDGINSNNDYSADIPGKSTNAKADALAAQHSRNEMAHAVHTMMHKNEKG